MPSPCRSVSIRHSGNGSVPLPRGHDCPTRPESAFLMESCREALRAPYLKRRAAKSAVLGELTLLKPEPNETQSAWGAARRSRKGMKNAG